MTQNQDFAERLKRLETKKASKAPQQVRSGNTLSMNDGNHKPINFFIGIAISLVISIVFLQSSLGIEDVIGASKEDSDKYIVKIGILSSVKTAWQMFVYSVLIAMTIGGLMNSELKVKPITFFPGAFVGQLIGGILIFAVATSKL